MLSPHQPPGDGARQRQKAWHLPITVLVASPLHRINLPPQYCLWREDRRYLMESLQTVVEGGAEMFIGANSRLAVNEAD